ncbi:hypothetical protein Hypma_004584 [Hypsizygus marmoreus]|uniref:DUF6533 domain-containing protein n=1 Tax=Hypsizygus marmoreus TaxID=39966 RepID=A0A369K0P9_HYPMA|nr:hypothetical protein Hypma_004584 [Hypsizygus marmoreus]
MAGSLGSTHFLQFCIQWSSIALLYYDYVLTFGMEAAYIWGQKFRFSTVLYVCCRYGLVANVIYLLTISNKITLSVPPSPKLLSKKNHRCNAGYRISGALSVLGRTAIIVVWGARTYAVFGKSRLVLAFFGTIGLMIVILDVIHVPTTVCKGNNTIPIGEPDVMLYQVSHLTVGSGLTTLRSIQALNVGGPWKKQKKGFMYLLFEQGILYFCVVTVFTIASLALNVQIPGGFLQRLLNAYTLPLSGLMTARFLLHLRKWESKHSAFQSRGPPNESDETTTIDFTSNPNHRSARSTSYVDEFGEDPVQRARTRGGIGLSTDGSVEESLP